VSRILHRTGLVSPRVHIVLIVAVTFLALLVSAGLRATPGVLMMLQINFGWDRATISLAAAGIFLYGLVGPFAAALMMSFGIRRTMLAGLMLMAISTFASLWMHLPGST
jgi:MFS family permease